jgi:hypothetical protein
MRKLFLNWKQTEELIAKLAEKVQNDFSPDFVLGIARGGLVPAVRISHLLGCGFRVIQVLHYLKSRRLARPRLISGSGRLSGGVLVVDDVADTGETLEFAVRYARRRGGREVRTATLGYKPHSKFVPDYFVFRTSRWVVFPWERASR